MLRRLHPTQPASFAFTPANLAWAQGQITKYPVGRQASAIIPLLWRAQEQDGWLSRPAIEHVADMLGMAYIRALEVATFYFMFHLSPVGSVAHIQICGTTSCLICGAGELIAVCREKIADKAHALSADGRFSWEEVECLGACTNAPMAQIGKDYYEDLTPDKLRALIDRFAKGEVSVPGPQNGRYAAEPKAGLTTLKDRESGRTQYNATVSRAVATGDTVKRIDGTEVPLLTPWLGRAGGAAKTPVRAEELPVEAGTQPAALTAARGGKADALQTIEGIGPALEKLCHGLGIFHFDQIAGWGAAEIAWMDANLKGFRGRVTRDKWVAQAKIIVDHGVEEFLRRAKTNDY
ncbi:MAG: NADH-quinone oxidoreductase subunit NuoE [Pseudorhodobacter sp.]|nr:NADH-quinone oxidoreductase subunit NuoE [Pseudorhodobacter sp.]